MARAQAAIGTKEVRLRPGVVSAPPALYSGCVALVLVGGRHGERLLSRARCQAARRRADRDGRAAGAEPRVMLRRRGGVVSVPSGWRPSHQRRPPAELRGRRRECDLLDQLLSAVRGGESRALVVRGEPGVGKTALLDYLAEHASGCRVARAGGVESELELAACSTRRRPVPAPTYRWRTCWTARPGPRSATTGRISRPSMVARRGCWCPTCTS
jgi:AAA ATPase domain